MTIPIPTYPSGGTVMVSGPVNVQGLTASGSPETANPVTIGGVSGGNVTALATDSTGRIVVTNGAATSVSTSPLVTNVTTAVLILNASRRGATVFNEGPSPVFLALLSSVAASLTQYTAELLVDAYFEVPYGYTGALTGITATGNAQLRVTEFT